MSQELFDGYFGGVKGPDPNDPRDFLFSAYRLGGVDRPESVTLNPMPPVYSQGSIGSCTAWAAKTAREFISFQQQHDLQSLSAVWGYYETRRKYWDVKVDSGAYMREVAKILAGRGMALESEWPNDNARWDVQPPAATYAKAKWYGPNPQARVVYYRIQTLSEMLDCLASLHPFIFGFPVYSNFKSAKHDGNVPEPKGIITGGHAQCAYGYAFDASWPGGGYILTRNSWGEWSPGGDLRFSFRFMQNTDVVWDVWTFRLRGEPEPDLPPGPLTEGGMG